MLEKYYIKPQTIDRIRAHWLAEPIERYVTWLDDRASTERVMSSAGFRCSCVLAAMPSPMEPRVGKICHNMFRVSLMTGLVCMA